MGVKAVLFDFDGTLFELKVDWLKVRRELKALLKFPGPAEEFKPLRPRIQEFVGNLLGKAPFTFEVEKLEDKAYEIISRHEIKGAEEGYPHEGAKEILGWCRRQGIKIVILTRNTKDCVLLVIKKYRWPQPNLIIAREDVKKEKPDPEAGLLALEKLQLQKEECLIVGDSLPDLELAKNLGIKNVLYHNPRHKVIPKDHADFFIRNLLELKTLLA
jgi:HAD superfamily hydrolase (TIGR01549 family)